MNTYYFLLELKLLDKCALCASAYVTISCKNFISSLHLRLLEKCGILWFMNFTVHTDVSAVVAVKTGRCTHLKTRQPWKSISGSDSEFSSFVEFSNSVIFDEFRQANQQKLRNLKVMETGELIPLHSLYQKETLHNPLTATKNSC